LRLPRSPGHNDWYHLGRRLLPGLQLALPGASLANLPAIRLGSLLCLNLPPGTVHAPPAPILPARPPRPIHLLTFITTRSPASPCCNASELGTRSEHGGDHDVSPHPHQTITSPPLSRSQPRPPHTS